MIQIEGRLKGLSSPESPPPTIYNSMAAVDPDAQWLQMAWLFYHKGKDWTKPRIEAMLRAVPQDKMILLDYYVEY